MCFLRIVRNYYGDMYNILQRHAWAYDKGAFLLHRYSVLRIENKSSTKHNINNNNNNTRDVVVWGLYYIILYYYNSSAPFERNRYLFLVSNVNVVAIVTAAEALRRSFAFESAQELSRRLLLQPKMTGRDGGVDDGDFLKDLIRCTRAKTTAARRD